MSVQFTKIISAILLERFGPIVEKIGVYLVQNQNITFRQIKLATSLPPPKIQRALVILIKHQAVTFSEAPTSEAVLYRIDPKQVLWMIRFPKYINLIKRRFGDDAEKIVEEILLRGYWTASETILHVVQRSENATVMRVQQSFLSLATAKYLKRVPRLVSAAEGAASNKLDKEPDKPPSIDMKLLMMCNGKKDVEFPDADEYWTVDFDRFHQDFRDMLIVSAFSQKFDKNVGEFMRILLQCMYNRNEPWAEVSNPIPLIEIRNIVRRQTTYQSLAHNFEQYVNILQEDSMNLIRRSGEASGGSFQIYFKDIFTSFVWELLEQMVVEKYDTKAARIFRLVKQKLLIGPEDIQRLVMLPAKEARKLTYLLLDDQFLKIREVRKGGQGMNQSFMLFYIDHKDCAKVVLELCYKTLFNIMSRKTHEKHINKRVIDKKQRIDTVLLGMKDADEKDRQEIEELINPDEHEILKKVENSMKKLDSVELGIDETIFLLDMFMMYK